MDNENEWINERVDGKPIGIKEAVSFRKLCSALELLLFYCVKINVEYNYSWTSVILLCIKALALCLYLKSIPLQLLFFCCLLNIYRRACCHHL